MAVYLDPLRDYFYLMGQGRPGLWCHLVTDGALEELHAFAARLGMPRWAFHDHLRHPHYDLPQYMREWAVMHDAGIVADPQGSGLTIMREEKNLTTKNTKYTKKRNEKRMGKKKI